MHKTILIIEDDLKIADLIQLYLQKEEYRTVQAHDGREGVELALRIKPDLIVLDRMLPEMEGLEVLKKVRAQLDTPVLILSAKADEMEKTIGLEVGADDYLSKPFSPKELVARVKAILRRTRAANPAADVLHYKDLTLDPEKLSVLQDKRSVPLSPLEFKLLHTLTKNPGRVFSRQQLMEEIYDSTTIIFDRTVDAHVKNLRKKLSDSPKQPRYLGSVFGVGYKLLDNETQPSL
ncbi:MAG: response regulator transcription factor [Patescibacteria group bacterium]|mgnify:FL=1